MQPIPAGASFSCHQPEMAHQQRRQLPRPHHPWPLMPMPPSSLVALQHAMSQWRNCCQLPPPLLLPPTPPAPLPLTLPQTPPLQNHSRLSANDQPSRPRHRHPDTNAKQPENSLLEACLEGRTVLAFNVGGEKRLCLPQVLHEVLLAAGLDLEQIGQACDRLGVLCQRCDARQMSILRRERVFDPFLESCGLITQSDAERLCKSLLCGRGTPLLTRPLTAEDERIGVRHRCFGKQRGLLLLRLYTTSRQACIACVDCCRLHTPAQFVGHAHQPGEVATCHWGFESANWRRYLLLDSKHRLGSHERERMQAALDAVKGRFLDEDGNRPMECSDSAVTADCSGPRNSASEPMDWQQQPQPQQPHFLSSSEESHGKHYSRCRLAEPKKWSPQQLQQQQQRRRRQQRKQITAEIRRMHRPPVQHQPAQNRRHLRPPVDEFVGADFAPNQRLSREAARAVTAAAAVLDELLVRDGREAEAEEELRSDWEALADWAEGHLPEKATPTFLAMVDRVKAGYDARIGGLRRFVDSIRQQLGVLQQLRQLWNCQQVQPVQQSTPADSHPAHEPTAIDVADSSSFGVDGNSAADGEEDKNDNKKETDDRDAEKKGADLVKT